MTRNAPQPTSSDQPVWKGERPRRLLAFLALVPLIGDGFRVLGDALRDSIDDRTLELIALRVSARRDCHYVWRGHCRMAHLNISEPLTVDEIARVAAGPGAMSGTDAAMVQAIDDLLDRSPHSGALNADLLALQIATHFYDLATALTAGVEPEPEAVAIAGIETPLLAARSVTSAS